MATEMETGMAVGMEGPTERVGLRVQTTAMAFGDCWELRL